MNQLYITSDYGHVHIGVIYLGWNNHSRYLSSDMNCGDETFGFCVGNFYIGCYADKSWCVGFLNENGVIS